METTVSPTRRFWQNAKIGRGHLSLAPDGFDNSQEKEKEDRQNYERFSH